jgi:outer membrane receptor for ferrienterochelin and colicin
LSTGNAYPGFLVYQGFQTWDGNARLTLHPLSKITLVSRYEYQVSTIATRPDAASGLGEVDSSQMHSHILGQNLSWTPLNWLCLQAGANYVISETKTPASDYTQAILNSQNNYWTINFNAGFVLDDKTDLNVGYFYYRAADGQNAVVNGLPLGTDAEEHSINATLTRRLTKNLRLNLKYAFTHYEDFASAGNYNFNAHVIFSSLQYRF